MHFVHLGVHSQRPFFVVLCSVVFIAVFQLKKTPPPAVGLRLSRSSICQLKLLLYETEDCVMQSTNLQCAIQNKLQHVHTCMNRYVCIVIYPVLIWLFGSNDILTIH